MNTNSVIKKDVFEINYIELNELSRNRFESFDIEEPETIAWIDSFDELAVFWDIGANIGVFSLYASLTKEVRVISFEPESSNFYQLNKNIRLNDLSETVVAYPFALMDKDGISCLHLARDYEGWACNSYGRNLDPFLNERESNIIQGAVAFKAESLLNEHEILFPNYVKIDVDGFEDLVILGFGEHLNDMRLKGILCELNLNLEEHCQIIDFLKSYGFSYSEAQVQKDTLKEGYFKGMCNVIFYRN